MAFNRRKSKLIVTQAKTRLSAMKQIDTDKGRVIDYGDVGAPLTSATFEAQIRKCEDDVTEHNQLLEQADTKSNMIDSDEQKLREQFTAVLGAASGKFGEDSNEIEMLGGTRKSERKRPTRKPKPS